MKSQSDHREYYMCVYIGESVDDWVYQIKLDMGWSRKSDWRVRSVKGGFFCYAAKNSILVEIDIISLGIIVF